MESLCLRHSILPPYLHANAIPFYSPPHRRFGAPFRPHRFIISSKKSDLQDFQGYAKPMKLLPTTEVKVCTSTPPEEIIKSIEDIESQSLYKILLRTSPIYGSELTDVNAGILVCIISENGDSILHRIPASSYQDLLPESEGDAASDVLYFQRNSVYEFMFRGPKLGKIEAIWISIESGRWRLSRANLTMINVSKHQSGESIQNNSEYTSIRYDFEAEDILLGEGGDISMIELRPCKVTEYSGNDNFLLPYDNVSRSTSPGDKVISKEESMREYADLKFSLLLYDAMLIFAGTSIASFTAGDNSAIAFLTGGIGGFLYLLLLQRSVDGLPAPDIISSRKEDNISRLLRGLKGPVLALAFAVGFAILVAKRGSVEVDAVVSPKDIMVGMVGFLACKLAVILAAFRPLSMRLEDTD